MSGVAYTSSRSVAHSASAPRKRIASLVGAASLILLFGFGPALGQVLTETGDRGAGPIAADLPAEAETSDQPGQQEQQSSIAQSLPPWLADPGGARAALAASGVNYLVTYIGETLGNARGGRRRDSVGAGRLDVQLDVDFGKALGYEGLIFHTNIYASHGQGLSGCCVGNFLVVSGLEAIPQVRLYELWFEKQFLNDKVQVRVGQLGADTEFLVSQYAAPFLNASFGWPASVAAGMPSGGPAFPTATPGIRLKLNPTDRISVLLAAFNGDPVGGRGTAHPQRRDHSGVEFRTTDPANLMAEAAYAYNQGGGRSRLPGIVKLGGWYHTGSFRDLRLDGSRSSLAGPDSSGEGLRRRGNGGVYAVVDQLLYRLPRTADGGVGAFARIAVSPEDRNVVATYADGGLTFKGFLPGRANDTFGIGVAYAGTSKRLLARSRDALVFGAAPGDPGTVRASEAVVEVTYQARVVPGFTIQPSVQLVARPGAASAAARDAEGKPLRNAVVAGLRATIRY